MNTSLIALLQVAVSLITSAHNNPTLSSTTRQTVINIGSQAIQIATQISNPASFTVEPNNSIYPGYEDLLRSPYLDANGNLIKLGNSVTLDDGSLSFGDLNGDEIDDAAVFLKRTDANGVSSIALAAMLNEGGILYNIADLPLGPKVIVNSHHIDGQQMIMNLTIGNAAPATSTYELIGTSIWEVKTQ